MDKIQELIDYRTKVKISKTKIQDLIWLFIIDLQQLQAEQSQILPSLNMSDYKKWYSDWLKQSEIVITEREKTRTTPRPMILPDWVQIIQPKQIDIDKTVDELYDHFDIKINLTARDDKQANLAELANQFLIAEQKKKIRDIISKHLIQKTTVPKDGEDKCIFCWWDVVLHRVCTWACATRD